MIPRRTQSAILHGTCSILVALLAAPPPLWAQATPGRTPRQRIVVPTPERTPRERAVTPLRRVGASGDEITRNLASVARQNRSGKGKGTPLLGVLMHSLGRQVDRTAANSPFDAAAAKFVKNAGLSPADVEKIVTRWRALPPTLRQDLVPAELRGRSSSVDVQPDEFRKMVQVDLYDFMVARKARPSELELDEALLLFGSPGRLRATAEKEPQSRRPALRMRQGQRGASTGLAGLTSVNKAILEHVNSVLPFVKSITDHTGKKTQVKSPMKEVAAIELGQEFKIQGYGFGDDASKIEIVFFDEVGEYGPDLPLQTLKVGTLKPQSVSPTEIVVVAPKPFPKMTSSKGPTTQGPGEAFSGEIRVRRLYPPESLYESAVILKGGAKTSHQSNLAKIVVQDSKVKKEKEAEIMEKFKAGGVIADIEKLATDKSAGARVGSQLTVYGDFKNVKWVTMYREHKPEEIAESEEEPEKETYSLPIGKVEKMPNGKTRANVRVPPQARPGQYQAFFQGDHLGNVITSKNEESFAVIPNRYRVMTRLFECQDECGEEGDEGGSDEIRYLGTNTVDTNTPVQFTDYLDGLEQGPAKPWNNKLIPQQGDFTEVSFFLLVGATLLESDSEELEQVEKYAEQIVTAVTEYQAVAMELLVAGFTSLAAQQYAAGAVLLIAAAVLLIIEGVQAADEADYIASEVFAPDVVQLFTNTDNPGHEWKDAKLGFSPYLFFENDVEDCRYMINYLIVREP